MAASTAADVLNAASQRRIDPIPGLESWKLTLFMRSMTEREKAEYEFSLMDPETGNLIPARVKQARSQLIAKVVCDDKGVLLFSDEQVKALMARDGKLVALLNTACRDHVGLDKPKKTGFDSISDDDSPTDSASSSDEQTSTDSSTN